MNIFIKILIALLLLTHNISAQENLQKVSIQLKWKYQFQFAGFIAAKEKLKSIAQLFAFMLKDAKPSGVSVEFLNEIEKIADIQFDNKKMQDIYNRLVNISYEKAFDYTLFYKFIFL